MSEERENWEPKPKETLGNFIRRRYHEYSIRYPGKFNSLAEFGKWIHPTIKQSTFSTWCTDQKLPTGKNIDYLAQKLGGEVYDILGVERKLTNPKTKLIDRIWDFLPEAEQEEWYKRALEIKRQQEEAKGNRRTA